MTTTTAHPLGTLAARRRFNKKMRAKGVPAKVCGRCHAVKAHSAFPLARKAADGRDAYCSACARAAVAAHLSDPAKRAAHNARTRSLRAEYARRPIDLGDSHLPKQCTTPAAGGCGRLLTRYEFNRNRSHADFRDPWCRDCKSRRNADRALMHRLRLADYWEEQGIFSCHICAGDFSEDDEIHIDHNWPRALGGTDDIWNLMPAHALCNMSKKDADPWVFLPQSLADAGIDFHAAYRAKP